MPDGSPVGSTLGLTLAAYLRDRRTRLDPVALGFPAGRRRTRGLRREEVAQRASISPTWYTLLEQGRGGAPSSDVLDRVARALLLSEAEREHLFLLGLGRRPEVRYRPSEGITPRLQAVLDAMPCSPALIRTVSWDVVAWNRAASLVLTDYGALPPGERNVLRRMFLDPALQNRQHDWQSLARFVVGVFRADVARVGAGEAVQALVEELCRKSPLFARLWDDHGVLEHGEGIKRLRHPMLGEIALDYSAFTVDGRPDLFLLVYTPAGPGDAARIATLLEATGTGPASGHV